MDTDKILSRLPYSEPFLFVDELEEVNENGSKGNYTFPPGAYFYKGHFKNKPVTPGVILTECMAQIGVVCLGIFLMLDSSREYSVALTSTHIDFYIPVFPGEKVMVTSEKIYFRFNKLRCKLAMRNGIGKLICKGEISGMIYLDE